MGSWGECGRRRRRRRGAGKRGNAAAAARGLEAPIQDGGRARARERERGAGGRAGPARAPRGGGRPRRPVWGAAVAGRPGARGWGGGCERGEHPGSLVAPHPSRGPRKLHTRPFGHYGDGRGSLCGALGPAAKPARPPSPRPDSRDSLAPGGAGPRRTGANAFRRPAFLRCFSGSVVTWQRARLSGGAWGSLSVAAGPGCFLVGWGGGWRWGKGRRTLASRYLRSPPPTEASLWNVSRPEPCPASLPVPREMRPIKVVFPPFSGWGRGEKLGNWSA